MACDGQTVRSQPQQMTCRPRLPGGSGVLMEVLWILALFVAVAMALLVPAWGGMAHEG
jgi:hypothetical protein